MNTRMIPFAGSLLAIEYAGQSPGCIVDFLYADIPSADTGKPDFTYLLTQDERTGDLCLQAGEKMERRCKTKGEMAVHLIGQTCYQLAYHSHGGLVMHAACVRVDGQGVLLPGGTGSGKSTLAAWLLKQGCDFLTDELVFIPDGANHCMALTRPLNLKHTARELLRNELNIPEGESSVLSSPGVDMVPPRLLGAGEVLNTSPLDVIVLPHFSWQGDFSLEKLTKAQAGFALMQCLINARNLPGHGLPEVIRLAAEVPVYQVHYFDFAQIQEAIESILS